MVRIVLWNAVLIVKTDVMSTQAPATAVSTESLWNHVPMLVASDACLVVTDTEETGRVSQVGEEIYVTVSVMKSHIIHILMCILMCILTVCENRNYYL